MPGIVITGHGGFASGLLQAVEQVVGPQPYCAAVDFPEQMSTAQLRRLCVRRWSQWRSRTAWCFSPTCSAARRFAAPASWRMRRGL